MPKIHYRFFDSGAFHEVFTIDKGKKVFKLPLDEKEPASRPERTKALWDVLNSERASPARLCRIKTLGRGTILRFIDGSHPNDIETRDALVYFFNKTGRIVVNAIVRGNFIKRNSDKKIICVDVDNALQLETRNIPFRERTRRRSETSLTLWKDAKKGYDIFFESQQNSRKNSVKMIKALLVIKANRPDLWDVSFLKNAPQLLNELAEAYDGKDLALALTHLDGPSQAPLSEKPEQPELAAAPSKMKRDSLCQQLRASFFSFAKSFCKKPDAGPNLVYSMKGT